MSKGFARDRAMWLDRVAADLSVPAQAFRTAYVLADYFNRETGEAWPSQATLCTRLGVAKNTLKSAVRLLVERGYLEVETSREGKRYRAVQNLADAVGTAEVQTKREGQKTDPGGVSGLTQGGQRIDPDGGQRIDPRGVSGLTPTLYIDPPEIDPLEETYLPTPDLRGQEGAADWPNLPVLARPETDAFEAFWSRYLRISAEPGPLPEGR